MIYTSIDNYVRLVDLNLKGRQEILNLAANGDDGSMRRTAILSAKYSGDGKEIVAGTKSAEIICYDLVANRVSTRVTNSHSDEINSVCWANRQHSNIFLSGSDDTFVRVWDRRSLSGNRPVGIFVGHAEGITNVCSKGDGIYVASNCKDQLLKVWDIRKMNTYDEFQTIDPPRQQRDFDYRYGTPYRFVNRQPKHESDRSLFTFKGHQVYQTLIRC